MANLERRNLYLAASVSLALAETALAGAADQSTRTVRLQNDGSYVVSNNQRISPAGKIVDLDSPVRAKAVAVNPSVKTNTAAVLLMGASEPIIVFNTVTGEVIQRYSPALDNSGSFTGITYSPDGTRLVFSQDDNFVAIATVDATGRLLESASIAIPAPDNPDLFSRGVANPAGVSIAARGSL